MLCLGKVCKDVFDKIVSIGEKMGYWLVKIGFEGDLGMIGSFFGVCVQIIGLDVFGGEIYFSIRR